MAWLRSPYFYGAVLLLVGALLRIAASFSDTGGGRSIEDLRKALAFQRDERPLMKLEPRYHPYAFAFIFAGSDDEMAAIKKAIDAELLAAAQISERGLAGVPEYAGARLVAVDLVLMALGAALLFRSLAFVLAVGFGVGLLHELLLQSDTLTGAPSEYYLAAVLAALIWCTVFWALRALREGRLKFSR
jgi:hypothetical protein